MLLRKWRVVGDSVPILDAGAATARNGVLGTGDDGLSLPVKWGLSAVVWILFLRQTDCLSKSLFDSRVESGASLAFGVVENSLWELQLPVVVTYPLALQGLESVFDVSEILFLDARPVDEVFPAVLATTFRMFRQTF